MPLDAITIHALAKELSESVVGTKIDKVQQPARDMLILSLRGVGRNEKLLLSAGTGTARVHLHSVSYENPQTPPMFCMLLRKHLVGARIRELSQPGAERMLVFGLDAFDELGVETRKQLIIELMGRNSNIILTGPEGHIIDCLRRVDGDMSRQRQVLPGLIYRMPPTQDKLDFLSSTEGERAALLEEAASEKQPEDWLLDHFSGLSPLLCRELSYLAAGGASKLISDLEAGEKERLLSELTVLQKRVEAGDFAPTMFVSRDKPLDFSFMPIRQYENRAELRSFPSFSALLEEFYTKRDRQEQMKRNSQSLYKSVKSAHERSVRKLAARREEQRRTESKEQSRKFGDLLTANLYRLKKGERAAEVEDYYEENAPKLVIPLDPLKSPQENAAAYYREYNKLKTAERYLAELLEKGEREERYLQSVLDVISRSESERELSEIRRELTETGFLRAKKGEKKEKFKETAPLRFVSSSGMEILVGRNNSQNDKLTLKIARRTDQWLHVQKLHGSHVVISCEGQEPDEQTILEAASLAAFYSQAREGGKVPVDYTQIRFVKKPSGAMPGAVIYTDYKTVIVEPDEKLTLALKCDA